MWVESHRDCWECLKDSVSFVSSSTYVVGQVWNRKEVQVGVASHLSVEVCGHLYFTVCGVRGHWFSVVLCVCGPGNPCPRGLLTPGRRLCVPTGSVSLQLPRPLSTRDPPFSPLFLLSERDGKVSEGKVDRGGVVSQDLCGCPGVVVGRSNPRTETDDLRDPSLQVGSRSVPPHPGTSTASGRHCKRVRSRLTGRSALLTTVTTQSHRQGEKRPDTGLTG